MSIFDDDAAYITGADFSDPVVFGAQSTRGTLDTVDAGQPNGFGVIQETRTTTLHIAAASLTGLTDQSLITVKGVSYQVRNLNPSIDGRLLTVTLVPVQ